MFKRLMAFTAGLLLTQLALAEPAVYRNNSLTISQGARVSESGTDHFRDITFNDAGGFRLNPVSSTPAASPAGPPEFVDTPAVFEDGELRIDNAAVITADGEGEYYSNVVLERNDDNTFSVRGARQLSLVTVNEVTMDDFGPFGAYVHILVEGNKSTPCARLAEPAFSFNEETSVLTVLLAEREQSSNQVCAQVITPFTISVYAPVTDLEPGTYTVNVNGEEEAEFTL